MNATPILKRPASGRAQVLRAFLALLLATALGSPILAAPAPRPAPPPKGGDDVREALRVLMIVSMKRALELSPKQEMAVVPKIEQIINERERYVREHQDVLQKVQVRLAQEAVPDQEFREAVVRLDQLEKQHRELETRLRGEIDRSLTARQQAQLRLFVPRFRKEIQIQIDMARRLQEQRYRGPSPPAFPSLGEDGFPDDEEF